MDDVYVHYMDGWMMYAFFHIIFLGRFLDFFRQIFRIFCVCMLCLYVCMYVHMYVCLYAKHMQRKMYVWSYAKNFFCFLHFYKNVYMFSVCIYVLCS